MLTLLGLLHPETRLGCWVPVDISIRIRRAGDQTDQVESDQDWKILSASHPLYSSTSRRRQIQIPLVAFDSSFPFTLSASPSSLDGRLDST